MTTTLILADGQNRMKLSVIKEKLTHCEYFENLFKYNSYVKIIKVPSSTINRDIIMAIHDNP